MSKNDSYSGGSTVIRWGSNWFSRPQQDVDPVSGETQPERLQRLAAAAERRRIEQENRKSNLKEAKVKKVPKLVRPQPDLDREARIAQQRSEAEERLSKVTFQQVRKKKIKKPKT